VEGRRWRSAFPVRGAATSDMLPIPKEKSPRRLRTWQSITLAPDGPGGTLSGWYTHRLTSVTSAAIRLKRMAPPSKGRWCLYPRERSIAQCPNTIELVRCKVSDLPFCHRQAAPASRVGTRRPKGYPAFTTAFTPMPKAREVSAGCFARSRGIMSIVSFS